MSDAALKTITKKYGNILVNGADVFEELQDMQVIPVSPSLDYALGGGFREGTWIQMIGDPKSGKTTTALQFAAACQKKEYGENVQQSKNLCMKLGIEKNVIWIPKMKMTVRSCQVLRF